MKALTTIVAVLALTAAAALSASAQTTPPNAAGQPAPEPHQHGSATAPADKGSSGWTGNSRVPAESVGESSGMAARQSADQPEMATGTDLNGPPVKFPPAKTPE